MNHYQQQRRLTDPFTSIPTQPQHSLDMGLEHFVCVSSIAALIGGPGMASYSSANAYLDALMRHRRQQGLPGTTFNMASLSDVGILKNNLSARKFQLKVRALCMCVWLVC